MLSLQVSIKYLYYKYQISGDGRHAGNNPDYILENNDEEDNNRNDNTISRNCKCHDPSDHRIVRKIHFTTG
jgi:hypothetical protein